MRTRMGSMNVRDPDTPRDIDAPGSPAASVSRRKVLSRQNTEPARSPVNASALSLRTTPHDPGEVGVAVPLLYDSIVHNISPV